MGATITLCPSDQDLRLAEPTWRNQKLKFRPRARGLTPAQRKEMLRREGYCCPTPGCPHRLWLQAHHMREYSQGGLTEPFNVLLVCCHTNIHEGRLIVSGCPEKGTLEFHDAKGCRLGQGSKLERAIWQDSYLGWSGDLEMGSWALRHLQGNSPVALVEGEVHPSQA